MTLVDLGLLLVVGLAAWTGWRLGLSGFFFGLAGLALGVLVGSGLAVRLPADVGAPLEHLLLEAGLVLVLALVGASLGRRLGRRVGTGLGGASLRTPDRALGAVVRGGLALVACWLVAASTVSLVPTSVARAIDDSIVLRRTSAVMPAPSAIVADVTRGLRVPADLAGLVPADGVAVSPSNRVVNSVASQAAPSVVSIQTSLGATGRVGSGFAVASGLVVTNVHVVAGAQSITVTDGGGTHAAKVAAQDSANDVAILRVEGLAAPPLELSRATVANGAPGVVMGYPGGGPLTIDSAVVLQRLPMVQDDQGRTVSQARDAYRIRATVRPGNSGGPLLDTQGRVIGIVSAESRVAGDQGYALTLGPLEALLTTV